MESGLHGATINNNFFSQYWSICLYNEATQGWKLDFSLRKKFRQAANNNKESH